MENVVTVVFNVESEAYKAFSELKGDALSSSCVITQMALVKKTGGRIAMCEGYDTGITTTDDTNKGGLIGMLVGILGGPLGMLFGGAMGMLIGGTIDADDAQKSLSLIERVSQNLGDGDVALIALVMENNEERFDSKLSAYKTTILRQDAAVVAQEVEDAKALQKEMAKEARKRMREAKRNERRQEIEEKRAKLRAEFEAFKSRRNKD